MKSRYNPILLGVILLGLVCALWLNFIRHDIEQRNDTVEMAMEYENLRKLAALEGLPEDVVLKKFRDAGINSLMVFDTTLERLAKKGEIRLATGGELRQTASLGADRGVFAAVLPAELQENAAYVAAGADEWVLDDVEKDLVLRYGADRVSRISASPAIVRVLGMTELLPDGKYDEPLGITQAPLGLSVKDLRHVQELGFKIIIRPQNYIDVDEEKINSIFDRLNKAGVQPHAFMPCGKESVGYPDKIAYFGNRLVENDMLLVMLEHYTQLRFANIEGLVPLAEAVDYKAARSYVIDPLEQKKISVATALHRWALTDEERNIRVNYIRPFLMPVGGKDLLSINLKYVSDIKKNVENRGYKIGQAGVFDGNGYGLYEKMVPGFAPYFPDKLVFLPVAAAIVAGCVLYLGLLFDMKRRNELILWAVLTAASCALLMTGRGLFTRQMLALGAAAVFPVLSMSFIFQIWDMHKGKPLGILSIVFKGIWQLALAVLLSLVGAAFLSAILTDSRFLLEIDIYRGVKLTFLLPLVLTAVLFIRRYDLLEVAGKGMKVLLARLNGLLDTGLTFKHVAVLLVLLFIVGYFVGRSGHTGGVPVPAIELKMRAFLEQVMYARPREKEFMIGHPFFFLAVMAVYKNASRWCLFALTCAAVIGQGSLVQTFCHMRTPVYMSLVRAADGYAVGIIFGIVGVLVLGALLPVILKIKRRYLEQ